MKVLVVDDSPNQLEEYCDMVNKLGYDSCPARMGREAIEFCGQDDIDIALIDNRMFGMSGLDTGRALRRDYPDIVLIIFTACEPDNVIQALEAGFSDYLTKPVAEEQLGVILIKAARLRVERLKAREMCNSFQQMALSKWNLIGQSDCMIDLRNEATIAAAADCTVLITGDCGTGKELVANYIHKASKRANCKFVTADCSTFTDELSGSTLYGHEKGAFTTALYMRKGLFELAQDGTLFLDEIGTCKIPVQESLLRALEERKYTRVGGEKTHECNFRLITATSSDLEEMIEKGEFLRALYYRLNTFPIHLPKLEDRRDDIPLLAEYFLSILNLRYKKEIVGFGDGVLSSLMSKSWPGNVRELRNCIEYGVVHCSGPRLSEADLFQKKPDGAGHTLVRTLELGSNTQETNHPDGAVVTMHPSWSERSKAREVLDWLEGGCKMIDLGSSKWITRDMLAKVLGCSGPNITQKFKRSRLVALAFLGAFPESWPIFRSKTRYQSWGA